MGLDLEEGVRKKDAGEGVRGQNGREDTCSGGEPRAGDWPQRYQALEGAAPLCGFAPGPVDA